MLGPPSSAVHRTRPALCCTTGCTSICPHAVRSVSLCTLCTVQLPRCPNGLCVLLASLLQFFTFSAIIWNTYIALNMHLTVLLAARIVKDEPRYMRWLHAGAWGPALLSTLITGAAGGLGSP